ncbi:indolepyruvate decarboxylase [Arcanobacterium wilhelmae]|uniref:Alpha-keto-acid decarboxylase n=1 Tax=Arcanobacterium wilhelmae TaxID=1803177 RepID=A0ABT9NC32_9ACTO|nr:thiamine pyrophosphate-binding protein [Arcanobacterium wilhelmae]MDP9801275.1 indolepyruvate decarboxylase [Arcanobacterium wilhelmae]
MESIGHFLLRRLREVGISHVIGVPGDFNLQLLEQFSEVEGIEFVNSTNELNAAYAADGYARQRGIGALLTTYGVGELSALNGVAGAAAEHVPVVSIAGAPPLHAMRSGLPLHHSLTDGNYINVERAFGQFVAGTARLTPGNAVAEIDRLLRLAILEKRPVHIQVPSDISYLEIDTPSEPFQAPRLTSDPTNLADAVVAIADLVNGAEKPALLIDLEAKRYGWADVLLRIARENGIRWATLVTSKAVLPETDPLFAGVYGGANSAPEVKDLIEGSDALLAISPRFIEVNSGIFTQALPENTVKIYADTTFVGTHVYEGVAAADLLSKLADSLHRAPASLAHKPARTFEAKADAKLDQNSGRLWEQITDFVRPGDVVVAEAGTSYLALGGQTMPEGVDYTSSNIWGAIGWTLPVTFGWQLAAPDRRHLLVIGDGSFQLTAQELSTILARGQKPVIVLINNSGYTIERYILGHESHYNDIAPWDYASLIAGLAPNADLRTFQARTEGELASALSAVSDGEGGFIEVIVDPLDAPDALVKFGPASARFDYGRRGPELPNLG